MLQVIKIFMLLFVCVLLLRLTRTVRLYIVKVGFIFMKCSFSGRPVMIRMGYSLGYSIFTSQTSYSIASGDISGT